MEGCLNALDCRWHKAIKRQRKFADALVLAARIDGREDLRVSTGEFESLLLTDWGVSKIPVVFDFGEDMLWGLLQKRAGGKSMYLESSGVRS